GVEQEGETDRRRVAGRSLRSTRLRQDRHLHFETRGLKSARFYFAVRNWTQSQRARSATMSLMITRLSPGVVSFRSCRNFCAVAIVTFGSSLNSICSGQTPQEIDNCRRTSSLGVKAKIRARSGRKLETFRAMVPWRVK